MVGRAKERDGDGMPDGAGRDRDAASTAGEPGPGDAGSDKTESDKASTEIAAGDIADDLADFA